jgi:hypothetical protein
VILLALAAVSLRVLGEVEELDKGVLLQVSETENLANGREERQAHRWPLQIPKDHGDGVEPRVTPPIVPALRFKLWNDVFISAEHDAQK